MHSQLTRAFFLFSIFFATNTCSCTYLEMWNIQSLSWKCVFVLAVLAATSTSYTSSLKRHCFQSFSEGWKLWFCSVLKINLYFQMWSYYRSIIQLSQFSCSLKHQIYFVNDDGKSVFSYILPVLQYSALKIPAYVNWIRPKNIFLELSISNSDRTWNVLFSVIKCDTLISLLRNFANRTKVCCEENESPSDFGPISLKYSCDPQKNPTVRSVLKEHCYSTSWRRNVLQS